jgi:hypothetical protein
MNKQIALQLFHLGDVQIELRRLIGIKEAEIKALRKELRKTEKEMSTIRSTEEYEATYIKGK